MKILILDDDEIRQDFYRQRYEGHDVAHAWTYSQFSQCLDRESPLDLIHLDHDLGDFTTGDTYVDGWGVTREFSGQHAARKVCELSDERLPRQVIIQSVNPDGAAAMKKMLMRRGVDVVWSPFSFDETEHPCPVTGE